MKVLIITRTNWDEAPRIRHQMCNMMLKQGNEVVFLEKPTNSILSPLKLREEKEGLTLGTYPELMHHQLKFTKLFQYLNAKFVIRKLKNLIENNNFDLVLNFNYDYSYLSNFFEPRKFISIINDNFIAQGKPWMKKSIREQMESTCALSYATLSVSYPLKKLVDKSSNNSLLFIPWCEVEYKKPKPMKLRNIVLYYGYINERIDWTVIEGLLERNISIRFVGPVAGNATKQELIRLQHFPDFEVKGACSFEKLDLTDVCCSIAPYRKDIESVRACTISNRAFRLLSSGIPVVYPNLPYLIKAPKTVIFGASSLQEYFEIINFYMRNFDSCQNDILDFLDGHSEQDRYNSLMSILG